MADSAPSLPSERLNSEISVNKHDIYEVHTLRETLINNSKYQMWIKI